MQLCSLSRPKSQPRPEELRARADGKIVVKEDPAAISNGEKKPSSNKAENPVKDVVKAPPKKPEASTTVKADSKSKSPAKKPEEDRKKRALSQEKASKKAGGNDDNGTHISPPRRYGPSFVESYRHTWSRNLQICEIHATRWRGPSQRLHEFPKSGGFQTMYD